MCVRWLRSPEDFSVVLDCDLESERTTDTDLTCMHHAAEDTMTIIQKMLMMAASHLLRT
jgi:hypothetical protein